MTARRWSEFGRRVLDRTLWRNTDINAWQQERRLKRYCLTAVPVHRQHVFGHVCVVKNLSLVCDGSLMQAILHYEQAAGIVNKPAAGTMDCTGRMVFHCVAGFMHG